MKIFLLIGLAIGLVSTEKLDRTYLPPPGSKFSGGSPGDIQVPLEYPKETYSTGQSQPEGIPELELGINRRPKPVGNAQSSTQRPGFTKFRNSYPQTTTSYAITQTTIFAPVDDYESLDQGSAVLNTTSAEQTGLSNYPEGQNYEQQPNQGQTGIAQNYNHKQQSTLAPYGSSTQRPVFASNRKPEPYLPPIFNKGQTTTGQNVFAQNNLGYPSGQPQGTTYQDEQKFSTSHRPLVNQPVTTLPAKQHNQFNDNVNIPSSTAASQYQYERFDATNRPYMNQQRFGSTTPHQNLNRFPGSQAFATSTVGPQYQDQTPGSLVQNQYIQNQNIPSTLAPQYQNGQRTLNPEFNLQNQYISSTTPSQYQDSQKIITPGLGQQRYQQNVPSFTGAPQYQNGQQLTTPGAVPHSQYLGNHIVSSTAAPEYQGSQQIAKPKTPQETISSNQRVFGSRWPSQQNPKYPEREIFPSSTTAPQFQNGQQFVASGADKPTQILGNQNVPSTAAPQNQDGQRDFRPGASRNMFVPNKGVFGSQVPTQQNQNQYIGNGNFPSTSAAPQFTNSVPFTTPVSIQQGPVQQNQYQSQGQQNSPSSTAAPEYVIPQYQSPESVQRNQNGHGGSQLQNEPQFSTPGVQVGFDSGLPDQQGSGPRRNQQFTSAPQYQSTFAAPLGPNQPGFTNVNQYQSAQPNYNFFPASTIVPQQFVTETSPQHDNRVQNVPAAQPASEQGTGLQGYSTSTSPDYMGADQTKFGPLPTGNYAAAVSGFVSQDGPDRPQAAFDRTAEILNYENILTPEGYSYSYDTSNGIHADETGVVGNGTRAQGGYSYTGDDGKIYSVFYSADENGFQPRGDHLPTPPPIPEAIQRVIEQANKDKESGISDDGSYNEEKYGHEKYDVNLNQLKVKNKIKSPINGANIPNRYENKVRTQNKKQFTPIGEKQAHRDDDSMDNNDHFNYENLVDHEKNIEEKEGNNQPVPNMRPIKVKILTGEDKRRKYNNKSNFNQSPQLDKAQGEDINEDVSMTNISADDDDLSEPQNLHDELDLINYDPNSRTDFHGKNKYLPKPKEGNKFEQPKRIRPMVLRDHVKTTAKEVSKSGRPSNRKNEGSQNVAFEYEQDFNDDDRVRKPFRKNKITQKVKQQSKLDQQDTVDNGDEFNSYNINIDEDNAFGDDQKLPTGSQPNKERNQYGNRRIKQPVKSKNDVLAKKYQNKNADFIINEEKGYEYTPPQNKFNSGEAVEFPTRTSITEKLKHISQKESQTTLRPFMTPNVYGDEELTDDDMAGIAHEKPLSPLRPSQKELYPGYNVSPDETESERFGENNKTIGAFGITSTRLPSRVQSTSRPQYEKQDNIPIDSSRRPGNEIVFSDNAPNKGASTVNDAFLSTTPLPPFISNGNNEYQHEHQTSNKPNDRVYEKNIQVKDARRPGTNDGFRTNSQGQLSSTTYRPKYVFGDRTVAPTGTVTVDGFGRPISSTAPDVDGELASKQPGRIEETFRPTVGRFAVTIPPQATSGVYQESTSAPGEDFSGPKQHQRFDAETGYYY